MKNLNRSLGGAITLYLLAGALSANAHPYASGVAKQGAYVSWILNEPATDVKVIFDNGTVTNDLGSSPVAGTNMFRLTGHTNFAIVVYKIGSNALTQISSDTNIYNSFGGPRGVVVNTNAETANFGSIYVANANPLAANGRSSTSKGIYVLNAASEDFLGLGNTAATAGMTFGNSTTYSPYKLGIGPDNTVYVGDAGSNAIGGVWRATSTMSASTNIFNLVNVASVDTATKGTNFGRVIGTPSISGTQAGGNLVLTATMWDMNVINPPGTYSPSATNYQDIYTYNIGSGPLQWKTYPTVVTNPICYGGINAVINDMQVAPDGKYYICLFHYNNGDTSTNVCVLSATGTVLWDSRTQSRNYFNDPTYDHLCFANTSITVSPDDRYVAIYGYTNMTLLLMSLTNGVPDISTLTTNVLDSGTGTGCYGAAWDAADNIYVTSGGSDLLRIYSLGLTTTCITTNDSTFANGGFSFTGISGNSAQIETQPANTMAQCSSNTAFSVGAAGAMPLTYQWYQLGTGAIGGATNSTLPLADVTLSESGNSYKVVVSNSINSVTSQTAVLTVIDTIPPVVTVLGNSVTNIPQNTTWVDPGATAYDTCAGNLSVITNGTVNTSVSGTYDLSYSATDPSGNSATNYRTVVVSATNAPPAVSQQPSNTTASCDGSATFSVIASGTSPLYYQWFQGATPLYNSSTVSGATNPTLTVGGLSLSESGSAYSVAITNVFGSTNSTAATLTVVDTNTPVITLIGGSSLGLAVGSPFSDPGATAYDPCAGGLAVGVSGSVNTNVAGAYLLSYTATGPGGVSATNYRTVNVYSNILPAIWTQFPGSPVGDGTGGDDTRSDDIQFLNPSLGYASRDTEIWKTTNGGANWNIIYTAPTNAHFRSLGFVSATHGFIGNLGPGSYDGAVVDTNVLYETFDGGNTWHVSQGLQQQGMKGFCSMQIYDSNTIYGAGRVRGPAYFVMSTNAGTNFSMVNLTAAGVMNGIMDVHFLDTNNGWLCGMDTNSYSSSCSPVYNGTIARTTNGGASWTPVVTSTVGCCYFWKLAWPSTNVGYCSLQQNGTTSYIIYYKTTNGGNTWVSNGVPISVVSDCSFYLQGIGFSDTNTGWMGGATCSTYLDDIVETTNGGASWFPTGYYDESHMNRFKFMATNWGYACGFGLELYSPPLAITNPQPNTVTTGGSAVELQAGAYTLAPATYQWLWDGQMIAGATNSTLLVTNASRTNEGSYSVIVSNSYGSIISSNATLQVEVPQLLQAPQPLAGGGVQLTFGDQDGTPLTSNDLPNLSLYSSSNLQTWQLLTVPFTLTNGMVETEDPTNYTGRFYRVIEQ